MDFGDGHGGVTERKVVPIGRPPQASLTIIIYLRPPKIVLTPSHADYLPPLVPPSCHWPGSLCLPPSFLRDLIRPLSTYSERKSDVFMGLDYTCIHQPPITTSVMIRIKHHFFSAVTIGILPVRLSSFDANYDEFGSEQERCIPKFRVHLTPEIDADIFL